MTSGIYRIRNTENGKMYIGSSKDLESRIEGHFKSLGSGSHVNFHFQRSWDKHGSDVFEGSPIEDMVGSSKKERLRRENDYFLFFQSRNLWNLLYNFNRRAGCGPVMKGSDHPFYGAERSEEHCRRLSESHIGLTHTRETREKMSKTHTGMTHSEETKRRIAKSHTGKVHSREFCEKVSEGLSGRTLSESHKRKVSEKTTGESNPNCSLSEEQVKTIRIEYEEGEFFQYELAEKYGISQGHVGRIVNGSSWEEAGGPIKGEDY